ncbi:MAG: helix-turn-helix domain-containing protein [Leptospirillia bacterium]
MNISQNGIKVNWDKKSAGQRVRALRGALSQSEFARQLGIAQVDVSRIELGVRSPSIETLLALAALSGQSVDYILTGQGAGASEISPAYGPSTELLFIGDLDLPSRKALRQLAKLLSSRSVS